MSETKAVIPSPAAPRLTKAQVDALTTVARFSDPVSSYSAGLSMVQLLALERRGLVHADNLLPGHFISPQVFILWRITDAGRRALAQLSED